MALILGSVGGVVLWLWLKAEDTRIRLQLLVPVKTVGIDWDNPMTVDEFNVYRARAQSNLEIVNTPDEASATAYTKPDVEDDAQSDEALPVATPHSALPAPESLPIARADPSLQEITRFGSLPVVAKDGRRAWQVYQNTFTPTPGLKQVSIIVTNVGLNERTTLQALQTLPAEVSLAFSPYVRDADIWMARARGKGHEVLMAVPMEPKSYPEDDPGPRALRRDFTDAQNRDALQWILGRGASYVGVLPMLGDAFTEDAARIEPVLNEIRARGLLFVDTTTDSGINITRNRARALLIPYAARDIQLDATLTPTDIQNNLNLLLEAATTNGKAVGVMQALPLTIQALQQWLTTLPRHNLEVAPISFIAASSLER